MRRFLAALAMILAAAAPAPQRVSLPAPSGDPRSVTAASDPLIAWAETPGVDTGFTVALAHAVERSPSAREAIANARETSGGTIEARGAFRPTIDVEITGQQALSRGFSHDPSNLIERSAPVRRADASITVEETLFDFGARSGRLQAARARDAAERARAEASAGDAALKAATAWIDYRQTLAERDVAEAWLARDREILAMVRAHVANGLGAPADTARVDAAIGDTTARLARAQGTQAAAAARFAEAFGAAPPDLPIRAPAPGIPAALSETLAAARAGPEARYAAARTLAARRDLAAARADLGPRLVLDVSAGKYSITDPVEDHDIRARLSLRQRLYGGGAGRARVEEAAARAEAASFEQDRIVAEATRDATIAWRDVAVQADIARALRDGYLAERRARDAYAEQFRVSRGTLVELLRVEGELADAALGYLRAVAAADLARWTLLARSGLLLAALGPGAGAA